MINYCMITEGRFVRNVLPIHIRRAEKYVDRFIFVDDGTFTEDDKKFLQGLTSKEVIIKTRKWDNNHSEQRNVYIKASNIGDICIVMDSDEFPQTKFLEYVSNNPGTYESSPIDIRRPSYLTYKLNDRFFIKGWFGIEAEDIKDEVPPPPSVIQDPEADEIAKALNLTNYIVFPSPSDFRKLNVFEITPGLHYEGVPHEALIGNKPPQFLPHHYYHIKEMWEIHRDGARNYVEGGGGLNLHERNPHWVELKKIVDTNWHNFRNMDLTPQLIFYLLAHLGTEGHEYSSEVKDLFLYEKYRNPLVLPMVYDKPIIDEEYYKSVFKMLDKIYRVMLKRKLDPSGFPYNDQHIYHVIEDISKSEEFNMRWRL